MTTVERRAPAVSYVKATRKRPGHFKWRLHLADGARPWVHGPAAPNSPYARQRAEEKAAEDQRDAIAKGCNGSDFDLAPPQPRTKPSEDAPVVPQRSMADWVKVWTAARTKRGLSSASYGERMWRLHVEPVVAKHIGVWTRDDLRAISRSLDEKVFLSTSDDPKERARGLSSKSARNVWGVVTKMLRDATASKLDEIRCREDSLAGTVEGPDKGISRAKTYLWPSEFVALVSCPLVPIGWRALYAVAVFTFLRAGELAALEWSDVDVGRGVAHVHRNVDRVRAPKKTKQTKTATGRRVPIERELLPLLRLLRDQRGEIARVLPSMPRPSALARKLRDHLKLAGVEREELFTSDRTRKALSFHDLRSTGITWCAVRGDDPLKIMQRAGHSSFSTTQGYIREAEAIREGFGDVFPPLPVELLGAVELSRLFGSCLGNAYLLVVTSEFVGATGFEKRRAARVEADLATEGAANGSAGGAEVRDISQSDSETGARDGSVDEVPVAELRPPSALLRRLLDEARALAPEDRRALLEELARALASEGVKAAG